MFYGSASPCFTHCSPFPHSSDLSRNNTRAGGEDPDPENGVPATDGSAPAPSHRSEDRQDRPRRYGLGLERQHTNFV